MANYKRVVVYMLIISLLSVK